MASEENIFLRVLRTPQFAFLFQAVQDSSLVVLCPNCPERSMFTDHFLQAHILLPIDPNCKTDVRQNMNGAALTLDEVNGIIKTGTGFTVQRKSKILSSETRYSSSSSSMSPYRIIYIDHPLEYLQKDLNPVSSAPGSSAAPSSSASSSSSSSSALSRKQSNLHKPSLSSSEISVSSEQAASVLTPPPPFETSSRQDLENWLRSLCGTSAVSAVWSRLNTQCELFNRTYVLLAGFEEHACKRVEELCETAVTDLLQESSALRRACRDDTPSETALEVAIHSTTMDFVYEKLLGFLFSQKADEEAELDSCIQIFSMNHAPSSSGSSGSSNRRFSSNLSSNPSNNSAFLSTTSLIQSIAPHFRSAALALCQCPPSSSLASSSSSSLPLPSSASAPSVTPKAPDTLASIATAASKSLSPLCPGGDARSPLDKMRCLSNAVSSVIKLAQFSNNASSLSPSSAPVTSDDLIPLLSCLLIGTKVSSFATTLAYLNTFSPAQLSSTEIGFHLVSFTAAAEFLKSEGKKLISLYPSSLSRTPSFSAPASSSSSFSSSSSSHSSSNMVPRAPVPSHAHSHSFDSTSAKNSNVGDLSRAVGGLTFATQRSSAHAYSASSGSSSHVSAILMKPPLFNDSYFDDRASSSSAKSSSNNSYMDDQDDGVSSMGNWERRRLQKSMPTASASMFAPQQAYIPVVYPARQEEPEEEREAEEYEEEEEEEEEPVDVEEAYNSINSSKPGPPSKKSLNDSDLGDFLLGLARKD